MAEPFLAEIKIFSFNFAPKGWAMCNGQLLPINQNQALFSLLGTIYGGDGRTTFALPDMRDRTPVHFGAGITIGQRSGQNNVTLAVSQMPSHNHTAVGSSAVQDSIAPANAVFATSAPSEFYSVSTGAMMNAATVSNAGGGQAHNNVQPSAVLNFCIALQGLFPSRN